MKIPRPPNDAAAKVGPLATNRADPALKLVAQRRRAAHGQAERHDSQPRSRNQDQKRHYSTAAFP